MRLRLIITNVLADHLIQAGLAVDMRAYASELRSSPTYSLSVYGHVADVAIVLNDHEKPIEDALAKEMILIPSVEARILYINK